MEMRPRSVGMAPPRHATEARSGFLSPLLPPPLLAEGFPGLLPPWQAEARGNGDKGDKCMAGEPVPREAGDEEWR